MTNTRHPKLRKSGLEAILDGIEESHRNAQSQRTSNSGSHFISSGNVDADGLPDNTGTLIGATSANGGIAPWVNDTTPPGKPIGLSATSSASMIFVQWDGGLEGDTPPDFDHISVYVDDVEIGVLPSAGSVVSGPYDDGTIHTVKADSWDNAHDSAGNPKPNVSERVSLPNVVASSSKIDADKLGIIVTQSDKDPQGKGSHTGDLWLKYPLGLSANAINDPAMTGYLTEWSWNGLGMGLVTNPSGNWVRMRPNTGLNRLDNTGTITLQGGDVVEVSVDLQCETPQDGINMYLGIKDSSGKDIQKKITAPGGGKWVNSTVRVQVPTGATAGPYRLDFSVNNTTGNTNTVVLCKNVSMAKVVRAALEAEWWWDGAKWVQIPVAIYLDQIAVREANIDSAVIGALSAGIIKSGSFVTPNGRVGFDSTGFWAKNVDGKYVFQATESGVNSIGGFVTALSGDRIQLSQALIDGTNTGGLQGIGDDPNHPYWLIWGNHSGSGSSAKSNLFMGTSPQQPQFSATTSSAGNIASVTGTNVVINGSTVNLDSSNLKSNGIDISNVDYKLEDIMGFWSNIQNYKGTMKLYKRAGVYYLDFNVQVRNGGKFPQNVLTPCIKINDSVRSLNAIDAWGYGSYGDVARVHVFGSGEAHVPGTVSVTVKGSNVDYVSCQLHWTR